MREWITCQAFNDVKTPPRIVSFRWVCKSRSPAARA
jgi:hypothetical protein